MKLHQPILLLTLSLATALALLADATPVTNNNNNNNDNNDDSSHSLPPRDSNDLATATNSLKQTRTVASSLSRRASLRQRRSSKTTSTSQFTTPVESIRDRQREKGGTPAASSSATFPRRQQQQQPRRKRRLQGLSTSDVFPASVAKNVKKEETQTHATTSMTRKGRAKIESSRFQPGRTKNISHHTLIQGSTSTVNDSPTFPDALGSKTEADNMFDANSRTADAAAGAVLEPEPSMKRTTAKRSLSKRAVPEVPTSRSYRSTTKNTPSSIQEQLPTTPLLLLPDSNSVWQTGTFQTVQWSKQYAKSLPKDTTVDIVLVEAQTNQKIFSLKRFIPFRRGSAQVWVPVHVPERVSFVLVLELYRGRSLEQVSTVSADSSSYPSSSLSEEQNDSKIMDRSRTGSGSGTQRDAPSATITTSPNIVRRSDISISPRGRKASTESSQNRPVGSTNNDAGAGAAELEDGSLSPYLGQDRQVRPSKSSVEPGTHRDLNDDDYYLGSADERSYEFYPDELRQEYPTTARPLELEHAFGLHQKVYTLTPYSLEWRTPERVQELLDYSTKVQKLLGQYIQRNPNNPVPPTNLLPKALFLSKVMVELVKDQTLESVAVLARDVPTETMFQFLSIQDRVPTAFYRLKVQMVVVQVNLDPETVKSAILRSLQRRPTSQLQLGGKESSSESDAWLTSLLEVRKVKPMEGWEFPAGGEVIDRYEAITRKFFVSQGAL